MRNLNRMVIGIAAAIALCVFPLSRVLSAQQPAPAQPAAQPTGPVLQLSMAEAETMALETNLGLKAERLNLDIASQVIASARSAFRPLLTSSFGRVSSKSLPQDFTQGSADISSENSSFRSQFSQFVPWFGGRYDVAWSAFRSSQTGGISTFNPRLGSSLSISFVQPLLRNLRTDPNRATLETAERRRVISDIQLQQRVVVTGSAVRNAYLSLIAAIENRKVAQQNMELAQQSLTNARARVAVGQAAQIDIIQSQAQVASFEEQLILADAGISAAEDDLRALILDHMRADYWQVHLQPTDTIELAPRQIDLDAAIKNALANRLDLMVLHRNIEITELNMKVTRNATLPAVDMGVTYAAQGTGGTQFIFGDGFPPPVLSRTDRTFGSALSDTFGGAYPSWTVGVSMSYPIGKSAAEASLAQQQLQRHQQDLALKELELQITKDVRDAARQVETSRQRVQATETALQLAQQQLDAEQRRFEVGLSTNLDLQTRQSQLAQARISRLRAMIAYNQALIRFDTVQKTQ